MTVRLIVCSSIPLESSRHWYACAHDCFHRQKFDRAWGSESGRSASPLASRLFLVRIWKTSPRSPNRLSRQRGAIRARSAGDLQQAIIDLLRDSKLRATLVTQRPEGSAEASRRDSTDGGADCQSCALVLRFRRLEAIGNLPCGAGIEFRYWPAFVTLSSRGLGHRPFTAVTRVRIPLGSPLIFIGRSVARRPISDCA